MALDDIRTVVEFLQALDPDGGTITDYAGSYGEPGYHLDPDAGTPLVVLGDYWCRCDGDLHDIFERHYPHVAQRLADNGVEFEWYDEWVVDHETDKAYRTEPDSYMWKPSLVITEHGDFLTPDDDIETWIDYVANEERRCLPSNVYGASDLETAGFTRHNGEFESGWHPGQDDDPATITADIRETHGEDVDIVFVLDDTGQFDIAFSAYIRPVAD